MADNFDAPRPRFTLRTPADTDALRGAGRAAPRVQLRDVTAHFGARVALRGISLDCAAGAVTAVIGPSGCG